MFLLELIVSRFTSDENATTINSLINCGKDEETKKPLYYKIFEKSVTDKYYDDENLLTIDFMNMARMDHWYNPDDLFDSSIEKMAKSINKNLVDFNTNKNPFFNHWFILDFPDHDVVRKVYTSNDLNYSNSNYKRSNNNLYPLEYNEDLNIYFNNNYYLYKTEISKQNKKSIKTNICIQLKLSNQSKNNKIYVVKNNFKCVKNPRNQWYFKQNNDYLNIVSVFDDRCLSYKNNKLNIDDCNNDDINEDFVVYNKTLCSRVNEKNCLDDYKILPVTLEPENINLNCQSRIIKHGYQCCSDSIEIDHTNEIGTWGYENGELCGITFDTLDLQDNVN